MQLKKYFVLIVSLVFLVFSIQLLMGSQFNNYEEFNYNRLKDNASKNGYVRVIVEMDVPEIEVLTTISTGFKTGNRGRVFIQAAFNADLALEEAILNTTNSVLHQLNGKPYEITRTFSTLPYMALSVSPGSLDKLKYIPEVLKIMEDRARHLPWPRRVQISGSADIARPQLFQSTKIVGADSAWGFGFTGKDWYVAVLDTGIRRTHEMFQGKHIIERCYTAEGTCPNGRTEMSGVGSAEPYYDLLEYNSESPEHGTHVAGIAAGNNRNNRYGVAKDANIIAVNVFSLFPTNLCEDYYDIYNPCIASWDSDQLKGLEFVYSIRYTYKIASVNMSLGWGEYSSYCDTSSLKPAIDNLRAVGIATVISSGNESFCDAISEPACISSSIAVGSTTKNDIEAYYSNWNDELLDLFAPGSDINSSNIINDESYRNMGGTSMASPHVTGAWALVKQFDENMSVDEALDILQETGTMITTNCGTGLQKPRLDVGEALERLLAIAPPINFSGEQVRNRSFLQTEYINVLTWGRNPLNEDKNVVKYRIYLVENNQMISLGELDSSTFEFLHRRVGKREDKVYAITAFNDEGQESSPRYFYLDFGISQ